MASTPHRRKRKLLWYNPITVATLPASLKFWMDASNIVGDGTFPLTTPLFQFYKDLTGITGDAFQNTAMRRPALVGNKQNGLPTLRFDGSNDNLNISLNISYTVNLKLTIIIAFKWLSGGGATQALFGNEDSSDDRYHYLVAPGGDGFQSGAGGIVSGGSMNAFDTMYIYALTLDQGVVNGSFMHVNGALSVQFTDNHSTAGIAAMAIGCSNAGSNPAKIEVAEVMLFTDTLSTADRRAIEFYLSQKWAIPVV